MEQQSWCEVDLEAVRHNTRALCAHVRGAQLMGIVKANAYGHGMLECARAAVEGGATWLGTFTADEAFYLRKMGIAAPIVILGPTDPEVLRRARAEEIRLAVISLEQLRFLAGENPEIIPKLHLKVDTGLGRLGVLGGHLQEVKRLVKTLKDRLEGVYSHLSSVEEANLAYTEEQLGAFAAFCRQLGQPGVLRHIAATAAAIIIKESHFDMVRSGIGLYGLWPSREVELLTANGIKTKPLHLKPALTWKVTVAAVKTLPAGSFVGYGLTYRVNRPTTIAVLPVGYADGYDRGLGNIADVLLGGARCRVLGRVAMNMIVVDVSGANNVKVGDEAVLLGVQGKEVISADELAQRAGTINYEITTRIPASVPRKYKGK